MGSSPTLTTRSRFATLIVGRMAEPMMEAVSLPPKETINRVSELPLVIVESFVDEEAKPKCLEGTNFFKVVPKLPMV